MIRLSTKKIILCGRRFDFGQIQFAVSLGCSRIGRSCTAGSCVSELAATIANIVYIQGEKTVLAASDVDRFYPATVDVMKLDS